MQGDRDTTLIPDGVEPPPTRCVAFEPVEDPDYVLRRSRHTNPAGETFHLLVGTHVEHADELDAEVLSGLRFWALVVSREQIEPLLFDDPDDPPEPAAKDRPQDDEFAEIRQQLNALDSRQRAATQMILQLRADESLSERPDDYVLWGIDPDIRDGRGHRYNGGKNLKLSVNRAKHKHGRVRLLRAGPNFHVPPAHAPFGAKDWCIVEGAAEGGAKWSEYTLTGAGDIRKYL
jgi:hypothetical protein